MQPVVGLGGSAGSLSALQAFFSQMPEDSGLAFVVVLHLSPEHESSLATLLQNVTAMPVIQVSETVKVQANCVYVIPPGKHLLMVDGELILNDLRHEGGKRAAVDFFSHLGRYTWVRLDRHSPFRCRQRRRPWNQADQRERRTHGGTGTGGGGVRRYAARCDCYRNGGLGTAGSRDAEGTG
jgi:CheB methylesterase